MDGIDGLLWIDDSNFFTLNSEFQYLLPIIGTLCVFFILIGIPQNIYGGHRESFLGTFLQV